MPTYTEQNFEERIEAHLNQSDYWSLQSSHYNQDLRNFDDMTLY